MKGINKFVEEYMRSTETLQQSANIGEGNSLSMMTLRGFIEKYSENLEEYYDEYFGSGNKVTESSYGDTIIFCLVDDRDGDFIPSEIRKKFKKAGKWRRDKLKHQWSYVNPLNRIQGYIVVKDLTNIEHTA